MKNIVKLIALAFVCFATNSFAMQPGNGTKEVSSANAVNLKTARHRAQRKPIKMSCKGFPAGTLVQTVGGDVPIEQLKRGDQVCAYDFNGHVGGQFVVQVVKKTTPVLIQITVNGESFFTTPGQRFLLLNNEWMTVANLKVGYFLLTAAGPLRIKAIQAIETPTEMYSLTITKRGNFCVSAHGLIVENIFPGLYYATNTCIRTTHRAKSFIFEKVCEIATRVAVCVAAAYLMDQPISYKTKSRKSDKDSNPPYNGNGSHQPKYQEAPAKPSHKEETIQVGDKSSCGEKSDESRVLKEECPPLEGADKPDREHTQLTAVIVF